MSTRRCSNEEIGSGELLPPFISPEDINQQAELLKLEGKVPHRGIIKKNMLNDIPELSFSNSLPLSAKPVYSPPEPISASNYEKLLDYLLNTEIPESIIYNFFENPDDKDALKKLLSALYRKGLLTKKEWESTKPKRKFLETLILEWLQRTGEKTLEEIVEYVTSIHPSKRPASAARTAIKQLIKANKIQRITNGGYIAVNN